MDFGLFIEFPSREGMTDRDAFAECFALVDAAESVRVDSVWLAGDHFAPAIALPPPPPRFATAISVRPRATLLGCAVLPLPPAHPIHTPEAIPPLYHIRQGGGEGGGGRRMFPNTQDG